MQREPDKIFPTRGEAELVRDRLNSEPPEPGYAPWYVDGPVNGNWCVIRKRGGTAGNTDVDPEIYEEQFRAAFERSALDHELWKAREAIRFESVALEGCYPDTELVVIFRALKGAPRSGIPSEVASLRCRFGIRSRIWPAAYASPLQAASLFEVEIMEDLSTREIYQLVRKGPCDPDTINWLPWSD